MLRPTGVDPLNLIRFSGREGGIRGTVKNAAYLPAEPSGGWTVHSQIRKLDIALEDLQRRIPREIEETQQPRCTFVGAASAHGSNGSDYAHPPSKELGGEKPTDEARGAG